MKRVKLTSTLAHNFTCPNGRQQVFLWDSTVPGLAVRAIESGHLAYVFQGRYQGKCVRMTIGSPRVFRLAEAREIARELRRQIEEGRDPRVRVDSSRLQGLPVTSDKAR
jgi:hypothetical protein